MNNIAIIPARSGSKGVQDKNIRLLEGKPLMVYSIEAAIRSGMFQTIMVSTDSETYREIAVRYGADVPFLRSKETATDRSGKWDVVREVLGKYREKGHLYDTFCVLQPTSPLRTAQDIKNAYDLFFRKKAGAVVSVCEAEHSPLWMNTIGEDGDLDGFLSKEADLPRQTLSPFFRLNGAIYLLSTAFFYEDENPYRKGGFAYVMDQVRSIDIDSELDFKIAEMIMGLVGSE